MDNPCGNLQQLQPDGIDPLLFHPGDQYQTAESIEYVVRQCVYPEPIYIDNPRMTADGGKIKTALALFDEVPHLSAVAVILDHIVWLHLHCGDNESIHVNDLVRRFLHPEDDSSEVRPAASLIFELTICNSIIHGIACCRMVKSSVIFGSRFSEDPVLFEADGVFTIVFLAGFVQVQG